jgi:predicted nucleic-acid-binding protein
MIGLDTSVVLRLLIGEPEPQAKVARRALEDAFAKREEVVISDLVVSEAYFALQHHYKLGKEEARALLKKMATSGIVILHPESSLPALDQANGAGLVDRLIVQGYLGINAKTVTFDRAMVAAGALKLT